MATGGFTPERDATREVQEKCDKVKQEAQKGIDEVFTVYTALKYRSQVVAGTNYIVKVKVSADKCAHLRIFVGLDETIRLVDTQYPKTLQDPI